MMINQSMISSPRQRLPAGFDGARPMRRPRSAGFVAVSIAVVIAVAIGVAVGASAARAAGAAAAPKERTIGYVMTSLYWSIYQTPDGKTECPKGFNDGPREQYDALFPAGKKRTVIDTQLKLESETWFPSGSPDPTPFHEATGRVSYGMNLDGKIGPNDFLSPDGEAGIDNQLYRALGCIIGFRGPDGVEFIFEQKDIRDSRFNRMMIELTDVDDLTNDNDVTVTFYRGLDRLLTDASGNRVIPGGSQRIDARFGKRLITKMHGKIVDGVLSTEPVDELTLPWTTLDGPPTEILRDARFRLRLTPASAEGMIGGYADVESWYRLMLRNDSTHHLSNGQISGISLYKALRRLADAHPDPKTGAMTAISAALDAKMVQVFIQHPQESAVKAASLR
jgi:hypothetical protein